jgi:cell division protein FtsQ
MARSLAAPAPRRLLRGPPFGIPRPLQGLANLVRAGIRLTWERRRLRIALIALLIAVPLLGGGLWLLRHSSLTAVEHVRIDGLVTVHGADAGAIEAALTNAAHGMSTLAVKPAALRAAVARYPIVRSVTAHASLPHGLRIEVVEQPPVAALIINGAHTAVAADGVVLGPEYLSSALPLLNAPSTGTSTRTAAATLPMTGRSVRGSSLLGALSILGAAPERLAQTVTRVYSGPKGLTIVLRSGLAAYFGDAMRAHAKWIALTRVLADPSSAGAAYIDVRLPERPAAGFPPGTVRPDASSTETESSSGSDPATAAELAAGLDTAVGGGSSASASPSSSPSTSGAGSGSSAAGEPEPAGSSTSGVGTSSTGSSGAEATSASPSSEAASSTGAESSGSSPAPGG